MATGTFHVKCIQHLSTSTVTNDDGEATGYNVYPGSKTIGGTHTNSCPTSLEKEGETRPRPGHCVRHHWTSTNRYSYGLVLKNGSCTEKGWISLEGSWHAKINCCYKERDPSYSFSIQPSICCIRLNQEDCPRCMEWVPQLTTFSGCARCNHIHNKIGPSSVPQSTPRFSRAWGWIHSPIRGCYGGYTPKNSLHWQ